MEIIIDIIINKFLTLNINAVLEAPSKNLKEKRLIKAKTLRNEASQLVCKGMKCLLRFPDQCLLNGVLNHTFINNGYINLWIDYPCNGYNPYES